jgi:hypothetical protein
MGEQGYDEGYDDTFNDRIFTTSLHNSIQQRPGQWPKSTSEMRMHTSHDVAGMPAANNDTAISDYMRRRPYLEKTQYYKPPAVNPSVSEYMPRQPYLENQEFYKPGWQGSWPDTVAWGGPARQAYDPRSSSWYWVGTGTRAPSSFPDRRGGPWGSFWKQNEFWMPFWDDPSNPKTGANGPIWNVLPWGGHTYHNSYYAPSM